MPRAGDLVEEVHRTGTVERVEHEMEDAAQRARRPWRTVVGLLLTTGLGSFSCLPGPAPSTAHRPRSRVPRGGDAGVRLNLHEMGVVIGEARRRQNLRRTRPRPRRRRRAADEPRKRRRRLGRRRRSARQLCELPI